MIVPHMENRLVPNWVKLDQVVFEKHEPSYILPLSLEVQTQVHKPACNNCGKCKCKK